MGYQDQHAPANYPTYPSDHGAYQEPTYTPAASAPYAGPPAVGADGTAEAGVHPSSIGQSPQHAAYPQTAPYPETGYAEDGDGYDDEHPGEAAYADSYGGAAYTPGYPADRYSTDPYAQDGYGGDPAGQG